MEGEQVHGLSLDWLGSSMLMLLHRMFLGKNAVMRIALGTTAENEHRSGLHVLSGVRLHSYFDMQAEEDEAQLLQGDTGLLLTNEEPTVVTEWFESYKTPDFARTGNLATHTVTLAAGALHISTLLDPARSNLGRTGPVKLAGDERAPSSMQSELAKLGLPSKLEKGVPTLNDDYIVCKEGAKLQPNQVNLLKHLGITMANVRYSPS